MDSLDKKIIVELQRNGRLSLVELADALYISESTARNRVKKLLDQDLMTISAIPNLKAMGYTFIGTMGLQVKLTERKEIAERLAECPEVCYVIGVTGEHDLMVTIAARSATEFAEFNDNFVASLSGVLRTQTYVWLNVYKGKEYALDTRQLVDKLDI